MPTVKELISALQNIENKEQRIWVSVTTEDDIIMVAANDFDKTLSSEQAKSVLDEMDNSGTLDEIINNSVFDAIRDMENEVTP